MFFAETRPPQVFKLYPQKKVPSFSVETYTFNRSFTMTTQIGEYTYSLILQFSRKETKRYTHGNFQSKANLRVWCRYFQARKNINVVTDVQLGMYMNNIYNYMIYLQNKCVQVKVRSSEKSMYIVFLQFLEELKTIVLIFSECNLLSLIFFCFHSYIST